MPEFWPVLHQLVSIAVPHSDPAAPANHVAPLGTHASEYFLIAQRGTVIQGPDVDTLWYNMGRY